MYYRRHIPAGRIRQTRKHSRLPAKARIITALLLLTAAAALINSQLRPLMSSLIEVQAQRLFTDAVNEAVGNALREMNGELLAVRPDADGRVTYLQSDAEGVNRFKTAVSVEMAERMRRLSSEPVGIPLGSLTGIDALTGRGPEVRLKLKLNGTVAVDLEDSFTEAGINQTRHRMSCVVTADIYAVIPGFSSAVTLTGSALVSEAVIVGEVPDSFTYVYGDQSDTIGRIFDYGDPYGKD